MEVLSKKSNALLSRIEYVFVHKFSGATPTMKDIREKIIAKIGCKPELLVVKKIHQDTGTEKVKITAYVYKDLDTLRRLEPAYILKRNGLLEERQQG